MPPPSSLRINRNPLDEARARFMEEPPRARFFPPVGQGHTSFGGYISPSAAASFAMDDEELDFERDRRATEMERNALSRLEARSRSRLMPHTESAERARLTLAQADAESRTRLSPFVEEYEREDTLGDIEERRAERRSFPERERLDTAQRQAAMDQMEYADAGQKQLSGITQRPEHHAAYEYYRDSAPPEIRKPAERQKYAYRQTAKMLQDQAAVDSIFEMSADTGDRKYLQVLEPVQGKDGGFFGYRLRADLKPAERDNIHMMMSKQRREKQALAEAKEERIAGQAEAAQWHRSTDAMIKDLEEDVKSGNADASTAEELKALKALKLRRLKEYNGSGGGRAAPTREYGDHIDPTKPPGQ